jgi:hypothetical protein
MNTNEGNAVTQKQKIIKDDSRLDETTLLVPIIVLVFFFFAKRNDQQ